MYFYHHGFTKLNVVRSAVNFVILCITLCTRNVTPISTNHSMANSDKYLLYYISIS